jgi:hypothetical protein
VKFTHTSRQFFNAAATPQTWYGASVTISSLYSPFENAEKAKAKK